MALINFSFCSFGIFGSPNITDLPPPCRKPAAEFFIVMARARRKHSSVLTSSAMRNPPIDGPMATLSITRIAFRLTEGSWR